MDHPPIQDQAAIHAQIDALRDDIADMQRSQRRAAGMRCQLRALAADPEYSALSRDTFNGESALLGMQADGFAANIARARAQIAELESKLTQGEFFNRIMDGQYAAVDETARLPYIPHGVTQQGRIEARGCSECAWGKVAGCWRCGSGAQLTSELLPEAPARTGRARPFGPIRQALYRRRPTYTFPAVVFLSVVCAFIWVAR